MQNKWPGEESIFLVKECRAFKSADNLKGMGGLICIAYNFHLGNGEKNVHRRIRLIFN